MCFSSAITTQTNARSDSARQTHLGECAIWLVCIVLFATLLLSLGPYFSLLYALAAVVGSIIYREALIRRQPNDIETQGAVGENESHYDEAQFYASFSVNVEPLVRRTMKEFDPPLTCEICLEELHEGDKVAGSPNDLCIHEFHEQCIIEALQQQTTCPCCRREYLSPQQAATNFTDTAHEAEIPVEQLILQEVEHTVEASSDIEECEQSSVSADHLTRSVLL